MAQRCERSKMRRCEMQQRNACITHCEETETHVVSRREGDGQQLSESSSTAGASSRPDEQQHRKPKKQLKCYNCKKLGYFQLDCKKGKWSKACRGGGTRSEKHSTAKMFTASLSRCICDSMGAAKCHDDLDGSQMVKCSLARFHWKGATGYQIPDQYIPLGMFQASLGKGFDPNGDVEEISINDRVPVYDASGNKMSSKKAVRLTFQLEMVRRQGSLSAQWLEEMKC